MSTAELPRPAGPLAPRVNGSTERARRPARKRGAQTLRAPAGESPAGFLATEVSVIDAEKWPVFPVVWWQPQLSLEPPRSSGLSNERRNRIPIAGFLDPSPGPVCPPVPLAGPEAFLSVRLSSQAPSSDLAPVGSDPRVALSMANGRLEKKGSVE